MRTRRARDRASADSDRRLDEYPFYPFVVDDSGHVAFDADAFDTAVTHLLIHPNPRAAGELIVIGEQNLVRDTFPTDRLGRYKALYEAYGGDAVVSDNAAFLENYRRIVNHLGRSFPNTGIEILLHNLVDPAHSLVAIENASVTGRSIGSGATNLVLDLKTRRQRGEDKINYELNIGARRFKCTTIPIFRPDFGLVGAICINIDTRFLRESVMAEPDLLQAFFDNLLRTDFALSENILSKDEYRNALNGKRHLYDEAIQGTSPVSRERRLAAILFSDVVGYTALMERSEAEALEIIAADESIHRSVIGGRRGRLMRELGDGMLVSFESAWDAVSSALEIRRRVHEDGRFEVRIGIHLGEVMQGRDDVHGDGVNVAARIQTEVGPGEIGISQAVYDNVRNQPGFSAIRLGERSLKNLSTPVVLYSVND
jgi:class 3 adenylate cyclase